MKKIMTIIGAMLFATFFLISCGSNSSSNEKAEIIKEYKDSIALEEKAKQVSIVNSDLKDEKIEIHPKMNEKLIFHIPPPSGIGTGVCGVTLSINNFFLRATETCGGHDDNGHTESTTELFKIELKRDFKYNVSKLINTNWGSSFGCEYFEIKENKLYLYDENYKIINDWFCTYGNIENREDNLESCDCIFLPSEN
jgi:hypothetical protein